ncbi:YfcC family protein [Brevibacillus fulvus]|uniref:Ion transporter superfamily protein YfcC n=1 Tax=Brevibacillus fulvus TaxID=1125967 RepID=A0A938Y5Q9_9BACL|nr:YfcC family protein [Brevibacillus fulvus]MBM7591745.1 putative ion transporter superfamily protein YfcC [Brevibacillus fulvus]
MQSTTTNLEKNTPKKKFPRIDAYVLIFCILIICTIATYLVPAGEFDRVKNGDVTVTVPGSYHIVESSPVSFKDLFTSIAEGMTKGASLIFLIMFTSGALAILEKTGAIDAFLRKIVISSKDKLLLLIIPVCVVFSILGTTGIIVNSVIAFVPLGIVIARGLKLDAVFGAALIYLGTYAGWNVTVLSPQTLGLSQRIAELPLLSGMGFRIIIYIVYLIGTIAFLYWYARRIQKDIGKSALGTELFPNDLGANQADMVNEKVKLSAQQTWVLLFSGLSLLGFIICTLILKWSESEMTALFIFIAIGAGIISRMNANEIVKTFMQGCSKLVYGALIVGMARAVIIILEDGKLLDTIVNALANVLSPLSPVSGAIGMFIGSAAIHFLVSSGSGESAMIVPILVPLADLLHITRQVAVQAVMFGEGLVNCVNPTSGVLMAILAMTGIPYGKWVKFFLPLFLVWFVLAIIFLIIGVSINWGPF